MSVFRPLLFLILLFIGNVISALPESYINSVDAIEEVSQTNDQNKDHPFFDVDNIKSESSIQVDARFRPNVVFSKVISEIEYLCMHKNKVALQYIKCSETIDFNLYSLKIIYPFHFFP
jgi:hypothetical protein